MNDRACSTGLFSRTSQGSWRIAGTRVSLDSVIHAFWEGATAEEICQDFPALSLPQIYSVLAHYLTHRDEIDAYLRTQGRAATRLRRQSKARHRRFVSDLRRRVLARSREHSPAA